MSLRIKALIVSVFVVLGLYGFNCSQNGVGRSLDGKKSSSSVAPPQPTVLEKIADLPYRVLNYYQLLQSMSNVTGQDKLANVALADYEVRKTLLASENDLHMINSPGLISATSIAGEVCNQLIIKEKPKAKNARSYFPLTDFTKGPVAITDKEVNDTVALLAEHFWGRAATDEEMDILVAFRKDYYSTLTSTELQATSEQTALFYTGVCSAMLSSYEFLTY